MYRAFTLKKSLMFIVIKVPEIKKAGIHAYKLSKTAFGHYKFSSFLGTRRVGRIMVSMY